MTIASARAQAVAEILWELKREDKLASLSSIAQRAGFSPGSGGRTVSTCLKTVRRDWPHLQWWRAVADNGVLDKEQELDLVKAGYAIQRNDGEALAVITRADHFINWDELDSRPDEAESTADDSV